MGIVFPLWNFSALVLYMNNGFGNGHGYPSIGMHVVSIAEMNFPHDPWKKSNTSYNIPWFSTTSHYFSRFGDGNNTPMAFTAFTPLEPCMNVTSSWNETPSKSYRTHQNFHTVTEPGIAQSLSCSELLIFHPYILGYAPLKGLSKWPLIQSPIWSSTLHMTGGRGKILSVFSSTQSQCGSWSLALENCGRWSQAPHWTFTVASPSYRFDDMQTLPCLQSDNKAGTTVGPKCIPSSCLLTALLLALQFFSW